MMRQSIHGTEAVMGMTWQAGSLDESLQAPDDTWIVSLRNDATGHQYLGYLVQQPPARAVSAAAWLALSVDRPTLLVARIDDDQYWLVIAMPNGLDYQTDFVGTADELSDVLQNVLVDYDTGMLQLLQCNAEDITGYHLPSAEAIDNIDNLFDQRQGLKSIRLKSNRRLQVPWKWLSVAAAALLAVGAGWYAWNQHQRALELDRLRQEAARKAQARNKPEPDIQSLRDARIAQAVSDALDQDLATPAPAALLNACVASWLQAGSRNGGWTMKEAQCTTSSMSFQWVRQKGSLATVRTFDGDASISANGNTLTVNTPLPKLDNRTAPGREDLPVFEQLAEQLIGQLQQLERVGIDYTATSLAARSIRYEDPDPKVGEYQEDGKTEVPPTAGYQQATLTIKGRDLWRLQQLAIDYPWSRLQRVVFKTNGHWEISLQVHAR